MYEQRYETPLLQFCYKQVVFHVWELISTTQKYFFGEKIIAKVLCNICFGLIQTSLRI